MSGLFDTVVSVQMKVDSMQHSMQPPPPCIQWRKFLDLLTKVFALWDEFNSGAYSARKLLRVCRYLNGLVASSVDIKIMCIELPCIEVACIETTLYENDLVSGISIVNLLLYVVFDR